MAIMNMAGIYSGYVQTTGTAPKMLRTGVSKREAYSVVSSIVRSSKTPKAPILKHGHSYIALVSFK